MAFLIKDNLEPQTGDTFDAEGNIINLATTEEQELSILNSIVAMEATADKAAIITGSFFGWLEDLGG